MSEVLYPLCAALAWFTTAASAPKLRHRPRDPAHAPMFVAYLLLAVTFTVSTPPVWAAIDRLSGITNLTTVVSQGSVVAYSAAVLILMTIWNCDEEAARRRIRLRLATTAVVLCAMVILFAAATRSREEPKTFVAIYAGSPLYDVYLLLYLAVFLASQSEIGLLGRRYITRTRSPWVRSGMGCTIAASVCGVGYTLSRLADVVAAWSGNSLVWWEPVPETCAAAGTVSMLVGLNLPRLGAALSNVTRWVRHTLAYRSLAPLWWALYEADPGIALEPPQRGATAWRSLRRSTDQLDYDLARRMVEIRDARLALRPFTNPSVAHQAEATHRSNGLTGTQLAAAVEAARMSAALHARAAGTPPQALPPPTESATCKRPDVPSASFDDELHWLLTVARAFSRIRPCHEVHALHARQTEWCCSTTSRRARRDAYGLHTADVGQCPATASPGSTCHEAHDHRPPGFEECNATAPHQEPHDTQATTDRRRRTTADTPSTDTECPDPQLPEVAHARSRRGRRPAFCACFRT